MGINGLSNLLKKASPPEQLEEDLKIDIVAVDAPISLHVAKYCAKKLVMRRTKLAVEDPDENKIRSAMAAEFVQYACKLANAENGVLPVFVFDGEKCPEKEGTCLKRREAEEKTRKSIEALRASVNAIRENPLSMSLKDMVCMTQYEKLLLRDLSVSHADTEFIKRVLAALGFVVIKAKGEAEKLCTALCREGFVDAVVSKDTDNLAMGCPVLLTEACVRGDRLVYKGYLIDKVLGDLEMSEEAFLDFCIACGCDFNTNMRGKGPAWLRKEYKKLGNPRGEWLEDIKENTACLLYPRCRKIFSTEPARSLVSEGYELPEEGMMFSPGKPDNSLLGELSQAFDSPKTLANLAALARSGFQKLNEKMG